MVATGALQVNSALAPGRQVARNSAFLLEQTVAAGAQKGDVLGFATFVVCGDDIPGGAGFLMDGYYIPDSKDHLSAGAVFAALCQ